jgi:Ca-activated chloride channel homolog
MTFTWPNLLLALLSLPVLFLFYLWIDLRRRRILARFGDLGFDHQAGDGRWRARQYLPPGLLILGLTFLLVSLSRPQAIVRLPRLGGTVLLAFDVSGSMAAEDMEPNRIEAAKSAARAFVERQPPGTHMGVVAFSDGGFSVQVPTDDQEAVLAALNRLRPQLGTSLANGILASLSLLERGAGPESFNYSILTPAPTATPTPLPDGMYRPAAIVLISDGENNEAPDPLEAAQIAADRGVRIFSVGVGTLSGVTLELEGFSVHTRLEEETLRQISQMTGGTYYRADDLDGLASVYDEIGTQLLIATEETEVTSLFAAVGLFILLIGAGISLVWFGRIP